ncbi:uncharacterized protein TNCV_2634411 [Trichonephila clavipes]|nr:uncharacterized protein TNCV_2634411 [Trichonephila clavipes]
MLFKDPETGAHTNSMEGSSSAIKKSLRGTRRCSERNIPSFGRTQSSERSGAQRGAAERRPVRSKQATAVRPCPYYLRSRMKQPEGIPDERRNNGIDSIPQNNIRRRSLSMEALDGDPVDRSE